MRSHRFSRTPKPKISNYSIHQEQRYDNFKKNYDLRQKECEYSRDLFDRSYERALDNAIFGSDSSYLAFTTPKSSPKPTTKPIRQNNSIFTNNLSPAPNNTNVSPKVSLYSNYSKYSNVPSSIDYQRRYFKLQTYQSQDFTLQSGSPRFGFANYFSRSKSKDSDSNNQEKDLQKEDDVPNIEEDQHKQPSKSTKLSNELSNTEPSSIKPLNGATPQNQPSKIETAEFDASNSSTPSKMNTKSRSTTSKSNSSSNSVKNKKASESIQSGSPSGSGVGAHLYSFENKSQSSRTKGKNNINISIDFETNENNNNSFGNEMMEELHASELESTPHGSFCEEEEEEVDINSNDIINIDNDFNIEEEEINQINIQIDEEENENEHEENENENEENENEHEETKNEHIENNHSNKSHRSSAEEENEFNKHLVTVAQKLESISSTIRTGSSSNPHSEMMNTNDEVEIMTTPNRAESIKSKSQSLSQQSKEITIAHSASSDFSPVVFGKSQSEISTDDSDVHSNDGIPKPIIDTPKVKNQKEKKT